MSPRKKKVSALRSVTQEKFEKSLKEAATKKEKKDSIPKIKVKAGLGRDPESDEQLIQNLENKYKLLKERKSHTAQIMMSEFDFLLELAREREGMTKWQSL